MKISLFVSLPLIFCGLLLASCGFTIQAEKSIPTTESDEDNNESTSADKINNIICLSNDYEICTYFKTTILQEVMPIFDGLIEINVPQVQNFYSNWDDTGSPRVSKSIVTIKYTIMSGRQTNPKHSGVVSDTIIVDNPYQFGSSVVSDLYTIRHSKRNAVDQVIKIIKHSMHSMS